MPKEYEGKKARESFEETMKVLFKAPKDAVATKKKAAKSGLRSELRKPTDAVFPAILAARLKASPYQGCSAWRPTNCS